LKTLKTILIISLTTATLAAATHEYPALFVFWQDIFLDYYITIIDANEPGWPPVILDQFQVDYYTYGLTWDGENFWVINGGYIESYDRTGSLVNGFASPAPEPCNLAFDGEYLWVGCSESKHTDYTSTVYCLNLDGTAGPYTPFTVQGYTGLAVCQGDIFSIDYEYYQYDIATFGYRYSKTGSFIGSFRFLDPVEDYYGESLASDGNYLYLGATCEIMGEYSEAIDKYDTDGSYIASYSQDEYFTAIATPGLSFGYTYGTGIDAKSLGHIKVFFR
jgi:hypothetical protein